MANSLLLQMGGSEIKSKPILVPAYHNQTDNDGEKYTSFAITHTDRVRISPIEGCSFVCIFCDLPYEFKYRKKDIHGLVESVKVALNDPIQKAKHVLISGGTPKPDDYVYQNNVYSAVATAFPKNQKLKAFSFMVLAIWKKQLSTKQLKYDLFPEGLAEKI